MKRSYYKATVTLKEGTSTILKHSYSGYKKIRYILKGENLKIWLYSFNGDVETIEFNNVLSVSVTKYNK